ncbi:hypothetical protein [Teredinibacter purpureus]|uniref:hypothetical protein n=1 Tax=Teredinibacter purpureus TaxID=2731756 RepID=UPI0005F856C2|nr:hypothetical protein [Teredinibacter purpureus]
MNPEVGSYLKDMRVKYQVKSYDEITSLGWIEEAPIKISRKKYYPAIWGQEFQGQALLVVQLTRWHIFKWLGSTDCIGFTVNKDGGREDVDAYWLMHEVGHP